MVVNIKVYSCLFYLKYETIHERFATEQTKDIFCLRMQRKADGYRVVSLKTMRLKVRIKPIWRSRHKNLHT